MAILQAARAYELGLPLETAHSWGLNRAIFIAAAKRGFKEGTGSSGTQGRRGCSSTYLLGDDMAFKDEKGGKLRFSIGGKVQTEEDFDRQVKSRFGDAFPLAWKEALAYVKGFDREVLLSTERFFQDVYRPVRDKLAESWSRASVDA
jgi:hypothetical protein